MKKALSQTIQVCVLLATIPAAVAAQTVAEKIFSATASLPAHLRDGAAVLDRSVSPSVVLRQGSNGITCMTDEPAPGYDASCVDGSWFAYGQRLGELRAEGNTLREANRIVNAELAAGTLAAPSPGALANTVSGPDADNTEVLVTVFLGQEASAVSGITTEENDQAWIMCAGTPQAHLMIGPVRYQLSNVPLADQCGLD